MACHTLVLSVAATASGLVNATPPHLRLAGFFPMTGNWLGGVSVRPAVDMALQDINADPDVLPNTTLSVVPFDSACSEDEGVRQLLSAHTGYVNRQRGSSDPPFVGLLGAGCSSACEAMQTLANIMRYPTLSYACTSPSLSSSRRYPQFLRTTLPDTQVVGVWKALCSHFGWKRVATGARASRVRTWPLAAPIWRGTRARGARSALRAFRPAHPRPNVHLVVRQSVRIHAPSAT
jgi:ionotropic glutamate receptor